jgi:RNA polymerase sigma factor (sigma-70 family)
MNSRESQLKDLAIRFRDSGDSDIFRRILQRISQLLGSIVYNIQRKRPQLKRMEKQDLYHAAIIGLYKAVLKVKEEEIEDYLVNGIIASANHEIIKWGKNPREKSFSSSFIEDNIEEWPPWAKGVWSGGHVKQFYDEPVYKDLECEFVRDRFKKLIEEGVIEEEDFKILTMRVVENMTYANIAKKVGVSHQGVGRRVKRTLGKIRSEFRKRGWEDDI